MAERPLAVARRVMTASPRGMVSSFDLQGPRPIRLIGGDFLPNKIPGNRRDSRDLGIVTYFTPFTDNQIKKLRNDGRARGAEAMFGPTLTPGSAYPSKPQGERLVKLFKPSKPAVATEPSLDLLLFGASRKPDQAVSLLPILKPAPIIVPLEDISPSFGISSPDRGEKTRNVKGSRRGSLRLISSGITKRLAAPIIEGKVISAKSEPVTKIEPATLPEPSIAPRIEYRVTPRVEAAKKIKVAKEVIVKPSLKISPQLEAARVADLRRYLESQAQLELKPQARDKAASEPQQKEQAAQKQRQEIQTPGFAQLVGDRAQKMNIFKRTGKLPINKERKGKKVTPIYAEIAEETNKKRARLILPKLKELKALIGGIISGQEVLTEIGGLKDREDIASPLVHQTNRRKIKDKGLGKIEYELSGESDLTEDKVSHSLEAHTAVKLAKSQPLTPATTEQLTDVLTDEHELGDGGANQLLIPKQETINLGYSVAGEAVMTLTNIPSEKDEPVVDMRQHPEDELSKSSIVDLSHLKPLALSDLSPNSLDNIVHNRMAIMMEELEKEEPS